MYSDRLRVRRSGSGGLVCGVVVHGWMGFWVGERFGGVFWGGEF